MFVHGKDTVVKLNSADLSAFAKSSEFTRSGDSHDVTTFGQGSHIKFGGLHDGSLTIEGTYDNTASTGPRAIIEPLIATVVTFLRQPEGTGSTLPQDTGNVLVQEYVETNPVADMVTWSVTCELSGDVDSTAQT